MTKRDVVFYASQLCITPKYLSQISHIVKRIVGIKPTEYRRKEHSFLLC